MEIGNTPNDYRDIRSNNYVRIEDGTLSIGNIQKSSEGYYLCEASNGIGAGLSAVILISVQGIHMMLSILFSPITYKIIVIIQHRHNSTLNSKTKRPVVVNPMFSSAKLKAKNPSVSSGT